MSNPFSYKYSVLFQTIQITRSTLFNCQTFLFQAIQFSQTVLFQTIQFQYKYKFCLHTVKCQNRSILIQFSMSTVSMSKTVPFQTIQFSINYAV